MVRRKLSGLGWTLLGTLAWSSQGCQGCLNLDEYTLVPTGGAGGSTGTGAGGSAPACVPTGMIVGAATMPAEGSNQKDECPVLEPVEAGLEVRAIDPVSDLCVARARVQVGSGATLESYPQIRFELGGTTAVAGMFRGGSLTFPEKCGTADEVVLMPGPSAVENLFVAKLERSGASFCTSWVELAYSTDVDAVGKVKVYSLDVGATGEVAIGGVLSGASVHFGDGVDLAGGGYWARYGTAGGLLGAGAVGKDATDAVMQVKAFSTKWMLAGAVTREQSDCIGCAGVVHVSEPAAQSCTGGGGAGAGGTTGSGGMAGAGGTTGSGGMMTGGTGGVAGAGTGGAAGGGGVAGGAPGDSQNALLMAQTADGACDTFGTFGSDHLGTLDSQAAMSLSVLNDPDGCEMAWTGLAGREPWLLEGGAFGTALFDLGGVSKDGFAAKTSGPGALCSGTPGPEWSLRVAPVFPDAFVSGERVTSTPCGFRDTVASFVAHSPPLGKVAMYRCEVGQDCDLESTLVELPNQGEEHLLFVGMDSGGKPDWYGMFSPLAVDGDGNGGLGPRKTYHDLTVGADGTVYAIFTTSGIAAVQNLTMSSSCTAFEASPAAGTYVVRLRRGNTDAWCDYAHRIGP